MASELQALGFNLNFAPVMDVHTNPTTPSSAIAPLARRRRRLASGPWPSCAAWRRAAACGLWQTLPRSWRHADRLAPCAAGGAT